MSNRACLLWSWFVRTATGWLPDAPAVMRLRGRLYGLAMPRCGRDFQVAAHAHLNGLQNLRVGDHVYLAPRCVVLAAESIELGDEVMVAFGAVITDGNHTALGGSYRFGPRANAPVTIRRGAWIGANAVVLPGVVIGAGAVAAAGSVVSRILPDGCVAGGSPARPLKQPAAA